MDVALNGVFFFFFFSSSSILIFFPCHQKITHDRSYLSYDIHDTFCSPHDEVGDVNVVCTSRIKAELSARPRPLLRSSSKGIIPLLVSIRLSEKSVLRCRFQQARSGPLLTDQPSLIVDILLSLADLSRKRRVRAH